MGAEKKRMGTMGIIGVLIGFLCLVFAQAGVVNTLFDLDISIKIYGTETKLPNNWETCIGLEAVGLLIIGLSAFGSFVLRKFLEAKGEPLIRLTIVTGAIFLLLVAGRGLYLLALTQTYGSMLAYYATDGDLQDVKDELKDKPSNEALDRAVWRTAQYDNAGALKLLMEAGANFKQETSKHKSCLLEFDVGLEYIQIALDHEVGPQTCPDSQNLIWSRIRQGRNNDEATAEIVGLLTKAGWSKTAYPKDKKSPTDLAATHKMKKTLAVLSERGDAPVE